MTRIRHPGILYILLLTLFNHLWAEHVWAEENAPPQPLARAIPVTVISAGVADLAIWESSVGQLESIVAPLISAEVPGRLIKVNVDVGDNVSKGQVLANIEDIDFDLARAMSHADIKRLQALANAQKMKVARNRELVEKNSINQQVLDDVDAQYQALRAELMAAQVRLQQAERNIERTRIVSPIDGQIDSKQISVGDYVSTGTPLFRLRSSTWLNARLPYPESLLSKLQRGLPVLLSSPTDPDNIVETVLTEVRPSITKGGRSTQVIVLVKNPGTWKAGATVTAQVQVSMRTNATVLPETSVVFRPSGVVVYVVDEMGVDEMVVDESAPERRTVSQRIVTTGVRRDGFTEILTGLSAGETVVVDGAGFLTDGAVINVKTQ